MALIEEKQIAKEILLAAIDHELLDVYGASSEETATKNLSKIKSTYEQILESVAK